MPFPGLRRMIVTFRSLVEAPSVTSAGSHRPLRMPLMALLVIAALLTVLAVAHGASAANRIQVVPGANATVRAISQPDADGTRYLGGDFTAFDQWGTGGGALIGAASGRVNPAFPAVTVTGGGGIVYAAVSDGSGGVYVGGSFTAVGGVARTNAAHINADGSVDPDWNPAPNGQVRAIATSGSTVFLGGGFTTVGGQSRTNLAAVGTDGVVSSTWAPTANMVVYAMAVSGSTVYVGGNFTTVNGVSRSRLAAIDTDGTLASFSVNAGSTVNAIAISGTTVYVGGSFTTINGFPRLRAAALTTAGTLLPWGPDMGGSVQAIAVAGSTVYLGGAFTTVGSFTRNRAAAVGAVGSAGTDGVLLGWNPSVTGTGIGVMSLLVSGTTVYIGGAFTSVGTETRSRLAAVDASGTVLPWNPNANNSVYALAVTGTSVYAGGAFTAAGGLQRNRLAAVSSVGAITPWNPDANAAVHAVELSGSTVYVGGDFTSVGGIARGRGAAVGINGSIATWDPLANATVRAISVAGSTVYIGGDFTNVGGQAQARAAAFTTDGLTMHGWNPAPDGSVMALVAYGGVVYLGGSFTTVGGVTRTNVAAVHDVDAGVSAGATTPWNPGTNAAVYSIAVSGGASHTVYLGGLFTIAGGASRNRAAAVSSDGTLSAWDPNVGSGIVYAIAVADSTVYLGGTFTSVGGSPLSYLAGVGPDGQPTAWLTSLAGGPVMAIRVGVNASSTPVVFVGGQFLTVGLTSWARAAALRTDTAGLAVPRWPVWAPPPTSVAATSPAVGRSTSVSFAAPDEDGASMYSLFDARCTAPGFTATAAGTSSPITVGGLTPGRTYTCGVTAIFSDGTGWSERASGATVVVPAVVPDAPGAVAAATPGADRSTSVSFTGTFDGGSAITGHDVTCTSVTGTTRTATGATSPISVGDLTRGADYTCTVTATNGVGTSSASTPSATISVPAIAPGAPTGVVATNTAGQVLVSWGAPDTGGSPITGYTVTASPGGAQCASAATACTVTGLAPGGTYTFTVTATNAVGQSVASAASGAVSIPAVQTPAPPVSAPAPAAEVAPAAAASATPAPLSPALRIGVPMAARLAATWAGLKVPAGARVALSVPRGESKRCAVKGGAVVARAPGTCTVTVTVTPRKGKPARKTIKVPAS